MAEQKGLSSDAEIKAALEELPGWKQQGRAIVKTYDLKGFKAAMAFSGTVGEHDAAPDRFRHGSSFQVVTSDSSPRCGVTSNPPRDVALRAAATKLLPLRSDG